MNKPRRVAKPLSDVVPLEDRVTPSAFALSDNRLLVIDTARPTTPITIPLVGINAGDTLVDVDIRPQNGFLYGLGYNANAGRVTLYSLSHRAGVATPITPTTPNAFVAADGTTSVRVGVDASTQVGFEFDPTADRVRVVTSNGQTFRIDPNNGAYVDGDAGVVGTQVDPGPAGSVTVTPVTVDESGNVPAIALAADGQSLFRFRTASPSTAVNVPLTVGSLAAGEQIVAIDFRPATGQLFGLAVNAAADAGSLYLIDPQTGDLTLVGATSGLVAFAGTDLPAPASARYGFDVNPTTDRIRVTTTTGLNFRIDPNTGAAIGSAPDGAITGATVSETAFTNSFGQAFGSANSATTQYTLDAATDQLYIQSSLGNGAQTSAVTLSSGFDTVNGFDIPSNVWSGATDAPVIGWGNSTVGRDGFVAATVAGTERLFSVNLGTGAVGGGGNIGSGSTPIAGLAVGDTFKFLFSFTSEFPGPNGFTWNLIRSTFEIIDENLPNPFGGTYSDIFDNFGFLDVGGTQFSPAGNPLTSIPILEAVRSNGTVIRSEAVVLAGLNVSREYAFLNNAVSLRTMFILSNPTGAPISTTVRWYGGLGTDGESVTFGTGGEGTPGVRWALIDDRDQTQSSPIGFVFSGPGANSLPSKLEFGGEIDSRYDVTVPAGQTIRLMSFTELFGTRADAVARGTVYNSLGLSEAAGMFADLDAATRATILNWNFDSVTANAGGPYTVAEGGSVALSGTATGTGAEFEWDFDYDGVTFTADATGATPTFSAAGIGGPTTRTVALRVTLPNGSTSAISTAVVAVTDVVLPVVTPPLPIPALLPGFAVGDGPGDAGRARTFSSDGTARLTLTPFPDATGGVRVAEGDFTGDSVPDLVVGTGVGGNRVRVYDGVTQNLLFDVAPFEATFTGGVWVSAGDLTGDGVADLVVSPDVGGGPVVVVYDGAKLAAGADAQVARFLGIEDASFRGGVRTAVGDINADGTADLIVTAGFGGGPRVAVFDGSRLTGPTLPNQLPPKLVGDFFVFEDTLRNGVYVAAGDLDGDRFVDLIFGGGPGGGPRVFALSGRSLLAGVEQPVANFFVGGPASRSGVTVAARDLDGDNLVDIVTGPGEGGPPVISAGVNIDPEGTPDALKLTGLSLVDFGFPGVFVG